jgi:radical SAM protein with 4Fe4S-binding SPASM domain
LKIRDYLRMDAEKEAKLRAVASFAPSKSACQTRPKKRFSPFEEAVITAILPRTRGVSKASLPPPLASWASISETCRHNCSGCPFGKQSGREGLFMNPHSFPRLLENLRCLKVKSLHLSGGGDPAIHPEFDEFLRMCMQQRLNLSLLTNAASLKRDTIKLMVESLSFLRVNLDASSEQVYSRIHHPVRSGEFHQVLANLEGIIAQRERRKSGLIVGAEVRLCQTNMNFMEETACLVKDLRLDYVQFRINRKASDPLLPDQEDRVNKLVEELKESFAPFPVYGEPRATSFHLGCRISPFILVMNSSGDVYPCLHFACHPEDTSFGNIFSQSPEEFWYGEAHRRILERLNEKVCNIPDCRWRRCDDLVQNP